MMQNKHLHTMTPLLPIENAEDFAKKTLDTGIKNHHSAIHSTKENLLQVQEKKQCNL